MGDMENEVKGYWNEISDSEWYKSLRTEERLAALRKDPKTAFYPEVLAMMKKYIGDFSGKKILLPSSGDNHAAFAFALMGAKVTSADISERQLENAAAVSDSWGLDIEYICDNTMYLSKIGEHEYENEVQKPLSGNSLPNNVEMVLQAFAENDWQYYHIKESVSTFKENLDHYSEVPSKAIKSPYIYYRYQKTGKVKGVETVIVDQKLHYSTKDKKIEIENTNYYSDTRKPEKYEPWKVRILYGT